MTERLQKVLASSGIASRRQAESWIAAGRVTVNGRPAVTGQAVGPRDRVAIDGRQVRIDWRTDRPARGIVYHRAQGEGVKESVEAGDESVLERLPKVHGGRWIPVSAMSVAEGGLELFLTDGALVAALNKHTDTIPCEYSLRLRGQFDESRVGDVLAAATADGEVRGVVEQLEPVGGEGANRWARLVCRGVRPRDLKRIFEQCGIELNRTIRTRFGPIAMERGLARGRSRELTQVELRALAELAGLQPAERPGRATAPVLRKRPGKRAPVPADKPSRVRAEDDPRFRR